MKIVINNCFGGFSLSPEAQRALVGKCPHVEVMTREQYDPNGSIRKWGDPHVVWGNPEHTTVIVDNHGWLERSCPALVALVETLGKAAWGRAAELAVVEIPDDVEWQIDDYDGIEHIAEVHRTWRAP